MRFRDTTVGTEVRVNVNASAKGDHFWAKSELGILKEYEDLVGTIAEKDNSDNTIRVSFTRKGASLWIEASRVSLFEDAVAQDNSDEIIVLPIGTNRAIEIANLEFEIEEHRQAIQEAIDRIEKLEEETRTYRLGELKHGYYTCVKNSESYQFYVNESNEKFYLGTIGRTNIIESVIVHMWSEESFTKMVSEPPVLRLI